MIKKIGGHLGPLPSTFFPKVTGSKFWNSHSVQLGQIPNNDVFGEDLIPHSPQGRGCKLKIWPLFIYSNGYYEVYRGFQGDFFALGWEWVGGGGYVGKSFHGEIYHEGRKFPWRERRIFQHYLKKNNEKINKRFFHLEVMSSIKT